MGLTFTEVETLRKHCAQVYQHAGCDEMNTLFARIRDDPERLADVYNLGKDGAKAEFGILRRGTKAAGGLPDTYEGG